jgi:uncharacterized protein with NRDE domain
LNTSRICRENPQAALPNDAKSVAVGDDLAKVVASWDSLTDAGRAAILAVVDSEIAKV